ncbi:hypothetical protein [Xylophilus ampelinus]|uniref:hypothetical protein n=1 Tax=Xylophilus ampelinus TaxID=54067 RepID=UPI0011B4AE5D|nr:hypothetical protein [Xylophilus ampelinus]MCS4510951.1 hypothetical protein [Xylophilus ampelinus]
MSDAAWSFWGSVAGSLVGGLIAWFVARWAAKVQTDAARSVENERNKRELLVHFLKEIDEYVHFSFREGAREQRQLARRRMTTTALIVAPNRVRAIDEEARAVEVWHGAMDKRGTTNFKRVKTFFELLQNELCTEHFQFVLPVAPSENMPTGRVESGQVLVSTQSRAATDV